MKPLLTICILLATVLHGLAQTHDPDPYCTSEYDGGISGTLNKFISKVEITDVGWTNSSGTANPMPGYTYFNNVTAPTLDAGTNYNIKITHSGIAIHFVAVFVDFNQDFDFDDDNELAGFVTVNTPEFEFPESPTTINFLVPASAAEGKTRMRVSVFEDDDYTWNLNKNTPPACTAYTAGELLDYGETEDYDVTIGGDNVAIEQSVTQTNITISPNPVQTLLHISALPNTIVYCEIINQLGEVVQLVYPASNTFQINVDELKSGLYVLRCYSEYTQVATQSFIKL